MTEPRTDGPPPAWQRSLRPPSLARVAAALFLLAACACVTAAPAASPKHRSGRQAGHDYARIVDAVAKRYDLPGIAVGPGYAQAAVESVLPGWGASFVALALFFFAFTTIIAYYYMAETNIAYINRRVHRPWLIYALRFVMLAAVVPTRRFARWQAVTRP